jgi:hypothetical protein
MCCAREWEKTWYWEWDGVGVGHWCDRWGRSEGCVGWRRDEIEGCFKGVGGSKEEGEGREEKTGERSKAERS